MSFILGYISIYQIIVLVLGIILVFKVSRQIKRAEIERIKRLKKYKRYAVASPVTDEDETIQERRIVSVETRFSLLRKIAVPTALCSLLLILIFPYLGSLPKTVISIALTGLGVTLGIACKSPIENFVGGLIISLTQPLRINDTVQIEDEYGIVEDVGITHVVIQLWDYRRLIINNSNLLNKQFINYSLNDKYQWAYIEFYVSLETDLALVETIAKDAASNSPYFADFDDPVFWVMEFGMTAIKCWVAAWAETPGDAWNLRHDVRTKLAKAFQGHNIKMHSHRIELLH